MRPLIERLVHKAKVGNNEDHRFINATLFNTGAMARLNREIAPRFKDLPGGFTRVEYLGRRRNDKAEMAMIEFTKNPIREYEENEAALEIEDFDMTTFWQWEANILTQEQEYFERKLRDLKATIDAEKIIADEALDELNQA